MLAGRKLLLADDSITIQKVVDLTFADEGVVVVSVNNGRDAIEKLEEFTPDIVLADVFMPQVNGYEVCEYIKQNEKLKHIPVMLLVGSFEPYDEAEARRVGADETLTKPFQSIRRLIDKVGMLVGGRREGDELPTAELRNADSELGAETLSNHDLEIVTADTQPLPEELGKTIDIPAVPHLNDKVDQEKMDSQTAVSERVVSPYEDDLLLDLGGYRPSASGLDDDFVLDVDLDETPEPSPVDPAFSTPAFLNRDRYKPSWESSTVAVAEMPVTTEDTMANTQEWPSPVDTAPIVESSPAVMETPTSAGNLSPEMIDAIARRAVEQLSEKVVQEIAWEVVPQLAELMIKRQLEEKNS